VAAQFRIGCSGWHYRHWAGRVYPRDLPPERWLQTYAQRFDTVELNNSFYRLPEADQFDRWRSQVPREFEFAVKASRFLTHFKRLIDPEEPLDRLLSRAKHLGTALGPLLYQLPPGWVPPLDRFERFLSRLPRRITPRGPALRHAVEFRDPRAYVTDVLDLLARYEESPLRNRMRLRRELFTRRRAINAANMLAHLQVNMSRTPRHCVSESSHRTCHKERSHIASS